MNNDLLISLYFFSGIISVVVGFGIIFEDKNNKVRSAVAFFSLFTAAASFSSFIYFIGNIDFQFEEKALLFAHANFVAGTSSLTAILNRIINENLDERQKLDSTGVIISVVGWIYAAIITIIIAIPSLFYNYSTHFFKDETSTIKFFFIIEYIHLTALLFFGAANGKNIIILDQNEVFRKTFFKLLYSVYVAGVLQTINLILITLDMIPTVEYYSKIIVFAILNLLILFIHRKNGLFLKSPKSYMNSAIDTTTSAILIYNENLKVVYANEAACLMLYIPETKLVGSIIYTALPDFPHEIFSKEIISQSNEIIVENQKKPVLMSIFPNKTAFGNFIGAILLLEDSSLIIKEKLQEDKEKKELQDATSEFLKKNNILEQEKKVLEAKLTLLERNIDHYETFDTLTELYNRASIEKEIDRFIQNSPLGKMAIIYLDIDDFKIFNETFGYEFGDKLLKQAGKKLKALENEYISSASAGADEFIIIYKHYNEQEQIEKLLNQIMDIFKSFEIEDLKVDLNISLGVALYPKHGYKTDELIGNADLAVSKSKREGKNNYRFYDEAYQKKILADSYLIDKLTEGMNNDELEIKFLPVYNVFEDKIVYLDAICVWNNPETGEMLQYEFNTVAKSSGMISKIDEMMIDKVSDLVQKYPDVSFTVHASPKTFFKDDVHEYFKNKFHNNPEYMKNINIEISETTLMENRDLTKVNIKNLRASGFKIFISKFGAQYTAISQLKNIEFDAIRPDKSFLLTNENSAGKEKAIIEAIYSLSRAFSVEIIADGVKNKEQLYILREMGFEYFQSQKPKTFEELYPKL